MLRVFVRSSFSLGRSPHIQALIVSVVLVAGLIAGYAFVSGVVSGSDASNSTTEDELLVIAAGTAGLVAIWGVWNQWAISRRNLTIQFLRELETDKDYILALAQFNRAARNGGDMKCYAHPFNKTSCSMFRSQKKAKDEHLQVAKAIDLVLNTDEMVAVGIRNAILDYRLICSYRRQTMMRRYAVAKPYIEELRTVTMLPTAYVEMERLAQRLASDPYHALL